METQAQRTAPDHPQDGLDTSSNLKYTMKLTPPFGTDFFQFKQVPYSSQYRFGVTLNMKADLYIYATGADPRMSDFEAKGGMFYVFAIPHITLTWSEHPVHKFFLSFTGMYNSGGEYGYMEFVRALPVTGSDTIDFSQTMNMFKDDGNTPFEFNAVYQETLEHRDYKQSFLGEGLVEFFPEPTGLVGPSAIPWLTTQNNNLPKTVNCDALMVFRLSHVENVDFLIGPNVFSPNASGSLSFDVQRTNIDLSFK